MLAIVLIGAIWALPARVEIARGPYELAAAILGSILVFALLRGEEARLQRELRTARAGSSVARQIALRRSGTAPWYVRLVSTTLGRAAMSLADGDLEAAQRALRGNSLTLGVGRLGRLRAVVDADLRRGIGAEASLGDAIRALYNMDPLPNLEAERYRIHVLVKALLEQADGATAHHLAHDLAQNADHEQRVYAVWLKAWFKLDDLPPLAEGDLRRALLLARNHGADDLVQRLTAELAPQVPSGED